MERFSLTFFLNGLRDCGRVQISAIPGLSYMFLLLTVPNTFFFVFFCSLFVCHFDFDEVLFHEVILSYHGAFGKHFLGYHHVNL